MLADSTSMWLHDKLPQKPFLVQSHKTAFRKSAYSSKHNVTFSLKAGIFKKVPFQS